MAVNPIFQRLQLLTGTPALDRLRGAHAMVFGIGGVGSWAAEALVRSGLGKLTIVDNDVVCITNVNRQLQATVKNVGQSKVEELAARLRTLNPRCEVVPVMKAYEPDTAGQFDLDGADYVLDCIDSISCKVELIRRASASRATLYSSMGAASKLDPTQIRIASVWETTGCPLARIIRRRLRENAFAGDFQAVFSPEVLPPVEQTSVACGTHACHCPSYVPDDGGEHRDWCAEKKIINGSAVHITAIFGMMLAGLVVQDAVARSAAAGSAPAGLDAFPLALPRDGGTTA
jgi:tRNA A37 threonylcarbamoyladenosine dehydratase